ncbi:S53 family peptidase [Lapillicoccus jejuensis]|uniref:Kumamolisin n=1 Tax=Lapillicoccus jejuensis TaxID=402171 RepID=A0A542DXT8_9MICO|nr:S53 family peptidase [Lapillicoccus jejuensis]TQJ07886.1 kumamolisin [Lapillicoccus jejuensis]
MTTSPTSSTSTPDGERGRRLLPGSERPALDAPTRGLPDGAVAQATLVLRRHGDLPEGRRLEAAELGASYGAAPDDLALVTRVLEAHGVTVLEAHGPSRRVRVQAPVAVLEDVFATSLHGASVDGVDVRAREGALGVPAELADVVTAVLGLDDRPQARTRHVVAAAAAGGTSYTPVELAQVYGMPQADGTGQTIAIVELGGGFDQQDLSTYFSGLGLPTPSITAVGVDGAANAPGQDPQGADGEVLLDIEVAGGVAPRADLVVYFAPNTDAGFLDAVATATHATPTPVALSISWGQSEDQWTAQARTAMDQAFADAEALGVVVLTAAGDSGSADGAAGVHVDFPSASPHTVSCGGTSLTVQGGRVVSETVWDGGARGGATGGGVSDTFPLPSWQAGAGVGDRSGTTATGRGVPDVAAVADPATGYRVLVDGTPQVIGGTSAVAPLWAGLVARVAQLSRRRLGPVQPHLYAAARPGVTPAGLRDVTTGSNGAYDAAPGWDACTGLGVPAAGVDALLTGG